MVIRARCKSYWALMSCSMSLSLTVVEADQAATTSVMWMCIPLPTASSYTSVCHVLAAALQICSSTISPSTQSRDSAGKTLYASKILCLERFIWKRAAMNI